MRHLTATAVLFALVANLSAAEPIADAQKAAERSLAFLAKDGLAWKEKRQCASCHHVPMTLWSLNEAKRSGYAIDEKALADLTAFTVAADDRAKLFARGPQQPKKLVSLGPLLLSLALQAGETKDKATRERLDKALSVLATDQTDEGFWQLADGRLPMIASPDVMTSLTLLALPSQGGPETKETKAAREKAMKWLASAAPDDTLQSTALRLVLRQRLGASSKELQPLAKQILSKQNADGGWSQTKEMASDAFATGQGLYALVAAGVGPEDAAIKKAQAFLVKTQKPDGSWTMTSRPMKPGGAGSKDVAPITHAGTAWGTLGLVRSAPKSPRTDAPAKNK